MPVGAAFCGTCGTALIATPLPVANAKPWAGFARWLGEYLTTSRMTGGALAERMDVSHATISRWKSGRQQPEPRLMPRLAQVTGVSELELLRLAGHTSQPADESALPPAKARIIELLRPEDVEITPEWLGILESLVEQMRKRP